MIEEGLCHSRQYSVYAVESQGKGEHKGEEMSMRQELMR